MGVAVELELPVTAMKGVRGVGLGGGEQLSRELRLRAAGEGVNEVDRDAERGSGRDRAGQERDRALRDGVSRLAEQLLAAAAGCRVANRQFLVSPDVAEMPVGLAEVDHPGSAA
jgi:hypothetical protein